ncbi:MAG TPA: DinB family protein [Pyrinomonadaceae bacterium]|nr:DinB family protein [Pyrinomonadaceae bacterium]
MKDEFIQTLEAGLRKLKNEVDQYGDGESFWTVSDGVNNSAGNLCLHLLGNLNHYIGAKLGDSGYVRDRPSEFSSKNVPREEILQRIDQTIGIVKESLEKLSEQEISNAYPSDEGEEPRSIARELLRIANHFNYHLGQINYARRLNS